MEYFAVINDNLQVTWKGYLRLNLSIKALWMWTTLCVLPSISHLDYTKNRNYLLTKKTPILRCVDVPRACGGIRRTSKFNELFRGFNSFKCDSLCKFNQHCFHTVSITSIFWFTLFLLWFVTHNFILIRHTNVCIHALLYTAQWR